MPTSVFRLKSILREVCSIPVASLFIIPLVHFPFLYFSFTQGKELTFKVLLLLGFTGLLVHTLKKEKVQARRIGDSLIFILLLSELALHALTNFLSENLLVALYGTFSRGGGFIFELYLFAFLVWNALFLNREASKSIKVVLGVCVFVAMYGCVQKLVLKFSSKTIPPTYFRDESSVFSGTPLYWAS